MKVLAIDPGYDRAGVAILERTADNKDNLLYSDCILTDRVADLPERLFTLGQAVEKLLTKYRPERLAIETIFFNKNIKTAIGVAQARGVILFAGQKAGCQIYEFGPQAIKVAVTGYGKSDKLAVIDMIKRLVKNAPAKALDDEYDAIAVGLTCLAHTR